VTGTLELVIPLGARLGHPIWRRALREAGVAEAVAEDVVQRIADSYVGWQEGSFPGLLGNVVAGRVANKLDLGGTNCVVDAACASSLAALHLAALELHTGRADLILTGGVDTFNDIFMFMCFSKTPALSPTGDARPFDAAGDGTILGEGLGLVALKRLSDARRDGDRIYSVLRGIGASSDGKGGAIYAPRAAGQMEALRRAYRQAGIAPDTVELVEAHGTGTRVGDATELSALTEVYAATGRAGSWCALGSVKSQIGHTKAAAGAAGLIKAALGLYHKVLPPTLKVRQPLEALEPGRTPFYVNADKRPWLPAGHPRRAAVSAFGFGGSNFHCVLEEAGPHKLAIDWDGHTQLLAFHGDSPAELQQQLASWPADLPWHELRRRAAQTRQRWSVQARCRLLIVAHRDRTPLARLLQQACTLLDANKEEITWRSPEGIYYGSGRPGDLAVLFPGQGAQYLGMGRDLACAFPAFLDTLTQASQAYQHHARASLTNLLYPLSLFTPEARQAAEAALRETASAQPALGAVGLGAWRVLEQIGVRADAFAGHSFGELTALCASGRLTESAFHDLGNLRGRLMAQAATGDGAMLAVLAPVDAIRQVLAEENLDLVLANRNAPRQTVLSGPAALIERAAGALSARQMRAQRLAVGGAFHSPLVAGASVPLRQALEQITLAPGQVPVYANTTAAPYPDEAGAARDLLAEQLARPVEFQAQVEAMHAAGIRTFLEVGPGARLTGLVEAILDARPHWALALDASAGQRPGLLDLACAIAELASLGYDLTLSLWDNADKEERSPTQEPAKPALVVPIGGANYVQPRPRRAPAATPAQQPTPSSAPLSRRTTDTMGTPKAPTNGSTPHHQAPRPTAPASDLSQALQITRESLASLQKMQEQTAQLHRQFLEGQESAHQTIHLLIEQQQRLLQASLGLAPLPPVAPVKPAKDVGWVERSEAHPGSVGRVANPTNGDTDGQSVLPSAPERPPVLHREVRPAPQAAPPIQRVLLEVISEKTGYPADMLEPAMTLDADLGIDSIKRVEILSALQERLPDAPEVKPEHLGSLHTLQQIIDFLAAGKHGTNGENGVPPVNHVDARPAPQAAPPIQRVLLEVISEKTGYPADMLEPAMTLDADLGIDSIKRVEILSALQERLPDAPEVKPEHLGSLHTLQQIIDFLSAGAAAPAVETPSFFPAPPREEGGGEQPAGLQRQVLTLVPLTAGRPPLTLPSGGEIWLTNDHPDLARCLASLLEARGLRPRLLPCAGLRRQPLPEHLAGLILLAPREGATDAFLQDALFGVQHLASGLRRAGALLASVSCLDGGFGLAHLDPCREPLDGGLAGLIKTARHEWPEAACKALDLARDLADPERAASLVLEELFLSSPVEVGLSASGKVTLELASVPLPPGPLALPFGPGDLVVLSGGARGVTAAVARAMARACRPTLVLLGRTPEPGPEPDWLAELSSEADIKRALGVRANGSATPRLIGEQYRQVAAQREVRRTLAQLQADGARVLYRMVDVRDERAVAELFQELRRQHGPVRGLIHGAGVLADARIEDKTEEQFQRVYGTKVAGLRSLLAALQPEEPRVLALFSSSTGRFGRAGQVDYAMANEVLNKLGQQQARLRPGCRVVSVNWGPWEGGMVTPGLRQLFEKEGVGLIDLEAGAEYLLREMADSKTQTVEIVVLGPTRCAAPDPVVTQAPVPLAFQRTLDLADHPILDSHVLDGRPVVPVALLLEWLAHGALHQNPGLHFHGCNKLRILHGVILDDSRPPSLRVSAGKAVKSEGLYLVPVELRTVRSDGRETLHARAEIVLAAQLPAAPRPRPALDLPPYSHSTEEAYQQLLFHGPDLEAIEAVEGCGPGGIQAVLRCAPPPSAWLGRPLRQQWLADPLVLDGVLQLAILWSQDQRGAGCLPCQLGGYRQYRRAFPAGSVRARVAVESASDLQVTVAVDIVDAEDGLIARLHGCQSIIDPGLARAFRHQRRSEAARP
jgi:acyl transferase domain-containing protein